MKKSISTTHIPRTTRVPPAGSPRWVGPASGLVYLAWGSRDFRTHPVPPILHHGWVYFLVLGGSARLLMDDGQRMLWRNELLLLHPDCPVGWEEGKSEKCEMLTWIWDEGPPAEVVPVGEAGRVILKTSPSTLRTLRRLHAVCREAVARSDALGALELRAAKAALDVEVARMAQGTPANPVGSTRFALARDWCLHNLHVQAPVPGLCEYLQVSAPTLFRLFRECGEESPGVFHRALRLQMARRWLGEKNLLVKEIAHRLGYRQPNDFTRAFTKYFGCPPGKYGSV